MDISHDSVNRFLYREAYSPLMANPEKKILLLTPTKAGRYHDKKLFDKETSFRFIPPD